MVRIRNEQRIGGNFVVVEVFDKARLVAFANFRERDLVVNFDVLGHIFDFLKVQNGAIASLYIMARRLDGCG